MLIVCIFIKTTSCERYTISLITISSIVPAFKCTVVQWAFFCILYHQTSFSKMKVFQNPPGCVRCNFLNIRLTDSMITKIHVRSTVFGGELFLISKCTVPLSLFADPERILRRLYVFAEEPCKSTTTTSEPCSPVFKEAQPRPSEAINQGINHSRALKFKISHKQLEFVSVCIWTVHYLLL